LRELKLTPVSGGDLPIDSGNEIAKAILSLSKISYNID
jgi:hypothetical protein